MNAGKKEVNSHKSKQVYIYAQWKRLQGIFREIQSMLAEGEISEITFTKDMITAKFDTITKFRLELNVDDMRSCALETLNFGGYENNDSFMILGSLRYVAETVKDPIFFDVGANEGIYTIYGEKLGSMTVHAFEPAPNTADLLCKNLKLNNCKSVIVNRVACSDEQGRSEFVFARSLSGSSGFKDLLKMADSEKINVETITLSRYCERLGRLPDILKIDVEGAEYKVIKGLEKSIKAGASKPIIICEILRKWSAEYGYNAMELHEYICSLGYKCYTSDNAMGLKECIRIDEKTEETNFLFVGDHSVFKIGALIERIVETKRDLDHAKYMRIEP